MTTRKKVPVKPAPVFEISNVSIDMGEQTPQHQTLQAIAQASQAWAEALKAVGSNSNYGIYIAGSGK